MSTESASVLTQLLCSPADFWWWKRLACVCQSFNAVSKRVECWQGRFARDGLYLLRHCATLRDYCDEYERCQHIAWQLPSAEARPAQFRGLVHHLDDFVLPETSEDGDLLQSLTCGAVQQGASGQRGLSFCLVWKPSGPAGPTCALLQLYYRQTGGCTWDDYRPDPVLVEYELCAASARLLLYRLLYHNYQIESHPVWFELRKPDGFG